MPEKPQSMHRRGAIGLSVAAAAVLPYAPILAAESQEPHMDLPKFKKAYTGSPYGQTHYRYVLNADSKKPPLICLHASPLSGIVYENWIFEMGKDRSAYAPDTPGFGGSDAPPAPVGIHAFAVAMIQFMDELGIEQADVMGYHTGSITSVDLARTFPDRIRKVVMISAPLFTAEEVERSLKRVTRPTPTFDQMLDQQAKNWREQGKGMFRDVPTDDRYIDFRLDSIRRFRTTPWGFQAAYGYDLAQGLSETKQPILLLNPEDDLWEMSRRAVPYLNAKSRIHDFPGWTHGHLDAHTAEMAKVVREFLDS